MARQPTSTHQGSSQGTKGHGRVVNVVTQVDAGDLPEGQILLGLIARKADFLFK